MRVRFPLPAWICLAVWIGACVEPVGPPAGAVRFTPSVRYRGWWALVEACSGRTGDFAAIRWYVLPNQESFQSRGDSVNGAYYPSGNRIVLGDESQLDGGLVRHEMLHALLPPRTSGHPRNYFLDKCGDIVVCEGRCESDAGGPIDVLGADSVVAPTALRVGTILAPNPVSVGADSGWFPLTVTVTNTASVGVQVAVPGPHYWYAMVPVTGGRPDSGGPGGSSGPFAYFAPAGEAGATRRFVFDDAPILKGLSPGDYSVTARFMTALSSASILHIAR